MYIIRDTLTGRPSGDGASFEALDNTLSTLKRDSQYDHRNIFKQ